MCISPPLPGFKFFNLAKIFLGNIYLPITALLEGASFILGFSITPLIEEIEELDAQAAKALQAIKELL